MPVLSATISCAPDPELADYWGCSMLRMTVWLPVRVLSAPPRSPALTEISRGLTNIRYPRLCGGVGTASSSTETGLQARVSSGIGHDGHAIVEALAIAHLPLERAPDHSAGGEANSLLRPHRASIAHLSATDLDRPEPGLDSAPRPMAV